MPDRWGYWGELDSKGNRISPDPTGGLFGLGGFIGDLFGNLFGFANGLAGGGITWSEFFGGRTQEVKAFDPMPIMIGVLILVLILKK